ncbi:MAG: hypothetical protein JNM69_31920 [Archangium sp.]|nr:hypothetical protein [Archangium sp.]
MSPNSPLDRLQTVNRALASGRPLEQLSSELGMSIDELVTWRSIYEAARRDVSRSSKKRWLGAIAGVALVLLTPRVMAAGTCAQTLPAPLVTFCADEPALASDVNGNFQQLVTWLQQKVGSVGTADLTTTGNINAANINATGALRVNATDVNSGTQVTWNKSGNIGETDFVNLKGLGAGGFAYYSGTTVATAVQIASISNGGKFRATGGVSGSGRLCFTTVNCADEPAFACGGTSFCSAGKVQVGLRDGTGCGSTNVITCCNLQLADNCP